MYDAQKRREERQKIVKEFDRRRAERIIAFRQENDFTQEDLSKLFSVPIETIKTMEVNMSCNRVLFDKLYPAKYYFGKKLKELREKNNFTQKHLANELKISISTIRSYEHYKTIPDLVTLSKISIFFKLNIQEFINPSNKSI